MNTYISVSITNYTTAPHWNDGYLYTSVDSCGLKIGTVLPYNEAKRQMAKLAVKYNLKITRELRTPTTIVYSVGGFLD